jgi:threonine/homoserine/homoserine lactone efflux protein
MNHSLWLYFLLVLGVVALPGMDMAYVVSSTLAGGARGAAAAIAGIVVGGIAHVLTATIGITALISTFPRLLKVVVLLGAVYMAWMGIQFLLARPAATPAEAQPAFKGTSVFKYGAVTCLVNPKAYAFMLAVFPSFLVSHGSDLVIRAAEISLITALTQVAVYGGVAAIALRMHRMIRPTTASRVWMQRTVGGIMLVSAVILARGWF